MISTLNYVDWIVVLVLVLYTALQARLGFFVLTRKFIAFIGAIIFAFKGYEALALFLSSRFEILPGLADALGFVIIFAVVQMLLSVLVGQIFSLIPEYVRKGFWSKLLGLIPAFIDSLIVVSLILFILVIVPAFPQVKDDVSRSKVADTLVTGISGIEYYLIEIFGGAGQESLSFLTVLPESDETVEVPFKATNLSVDEEAESEMLRLVNEERAKVGAGVLVMDETIVPVARAHSRDMWERQYFSHTNPDGEDPFERMEEGGVEFSSAGENLALARTVAQAHQGLMNSPGHRRNILDPNFTRIGIGAISGGIYGKMFTQNFAR